MKAQPMTFSRQQLYDLVWETPITALASTYLISANGLRETCKNMAVPLPDSGYWSKRKAGKAITRKPLIQEYSGEQHLTLPLRPADGSGINIDASPEVKWQKVFEQDPLLNFNVPSKLTNPVSLVAAAAKALKDSQPYDGLVHAGRYQLSMHVSPASVGRSLRFMDTFLKLLTKRQFKVNVTEQGSFLVVGNDSLAMSLRETRRQELSTEKNWRRMIYHPTGKLVLEIKCFMGGITCSDGTALLEAQLPNILARVEVMSQRVQEWRAEQEKQQNAYKERQRQERELAERKRAEVNLFKKSLEDAQCWREAQSFREYISQVKARAIATDSLTIEMESWIEWASKKADWLDPLVNSPDELLDGLRPYSLLPVSSPSTTNQPYVHTSHLYRE